MARRVGPGKDDDVSEALRIMVGLPFSLSSSSSSSSERCSSVHSIPYVGMKIMQVRSYTLYIIMSPCHLILLRERVREKESRELPQSGFISSTSSIDDIQKFDPSYNHFF